MSPQRSPRVSRRVVVVALTLTVLGGGSAIASAETKHVTCLINTDSTSSGPDKGICVVVPLPDLPVR